MGIKEIAENRIVEKLINKISPTAIAKEDLYGFKSFTGNQYTNKGLMLEDIANEPEEIDDNLVVYKQIDQKQDPSLDQFAILLKQTDLIKSVIKQQQKCFINQNLNHKIIFYRTS